MAPRRKVSVRGEEKQQPERMITRSALKKRLGSSGDVNNQQPRQPERKIQKKKKKSFKYDDKKKSKLAKDKPDKKKSNLAKDKPRKEKHRRFTYQERAEYHKRVKQSQGFDVGDVPSNIRDEDLLLRPLLILPLLPHPGAVEILKELEDLCKLAIKKYNKDNNTKYKFAKFLKANYAVFIMRTISSPFRPRKMQVLALKTSKLA